MKKTFLLIASAMILYSTACHRGHEKHAWNSPADSLRAVLDVISREISANQGNSDLYLKRANV